MKTFFNQYLWGERAYLTYWYVFLLSLPFSWRTVLIPSVTGGQFNEYMDFPLYIGDILILFTLISILKHRKEIKSIILIKLFHVEQLPIIFILAYLTLSIFWSSNILLWLDGIWGITRIIIISSIFIFTLTDDNSSKNCSTWNNLKYFTFVFSLMLVIQCGIGTMQFSSNHSFKLNFLGESILSPEIKGVAKIDFEQYKQIRAYGTFLHPNIFAGYIVIGILFILFYLKRSKKLFHVEQYYYGFVLFFLLIGLFITFSKGAIVSLILSIVLILFHVEQNKDYLPLNLKMKRIFNHKHNLFGLFHVEQFILGILFLSLFFIVYLSGHDLVIKSASERIDIYKQYSINTRDFVFGQGIGQSVYNMWSKNSDLESWHYQPIHNVYVLSILELGLLGSGILLFLIYSMLKKNVPRGTIPLTLTTIVCLGTLAMFDHYLWDIYAGQVLLAITFGWFFATSITNIDN